ncbi:pyridoxamine 5'-phosphate oxidase-like protein [Glaciihabitans tibetensis]|uniref:Pyridoxamine 5'-phosphate oxidase-like protein n=1 Tax=Glaciihabitans tibetensis TaxID=1266600 RepID=A0A2T0VG30_9MICO|nr:pyridoxamine 5'-phosphate oxidase family protein [Glaciihabitans tibetensis]PRY69126.1 pyridoxamine 5'-phosphate oxidase-like protein [Glaciihabitans tibetensis]
MLENDHDLDGWSPQGPVTELSPASSWELLNSASFGRLGVSVDNQPKIFPVNYHADGSAIIFRTAAGTKLHDLIANRSVVFEVDSRSAQGAWSVIAEGNAEVIDDSDEITAAERLPLPEWVPVQTYVFVRIIPTHLHGRRFLRHVEVSRHESPVAEQNEQNGPAL